MDLDTLSGGQTDLLTRFAEEVRRSPHNLVSRRAREELSTRHVPEAVALARRLPGGRQRLLDVGSGGGFPGMVIAIVRPDLDVHLLEATRKKAVFLSETAAGLGLDVTVHHGRAEDLASGALANGFDLVTARAVAPLDELLPLTLPFLAPEGRLYAVKGQQWPEELAAASAQLARSGAVVLATPDGPTPDRPADDPAADRPGDEPAPGRPTDDAGPRVLVIGRTR